MVAIIDEFTNQVVQFIPRVAMGVVILLAFWLVSLAVQKLIVRLSRRSHIVPDVLNLLQQAAKTALLIFGGITALGTMGIDISALVAGLGLTAFALGFAFRDILSNLLAGVLILIYRPFQRSDRIAVQGFEGTVIEIGLRYTALQGEEKKILIPNSNLFTNPVSVLDKRT